MRARRSDEERRALSQRIDASLLRIKIIGALLVAVLVLGGAIALLLSRMIGPGY
jgi:hypothetical protein